MSMSIEQQTAGANSSGEFQPPNARRRKKHRNWLIAFLLTISLGAGYFWQQSDIEVQQDEPLIATVKFGSIENTIAAAGSLQPSKLVDVGAQVSGQLQKLYVEIGDLVEEGQLLAEIDARVQENRVVASRASIEALEAQVTARNASLELARANHERQKRLMAEDATSQLDYDTAVSNLASARSSVIQLEKQIQQSRASLASDVTELEYSKIYAPTAGTVVSIEMTEGRTLQASQQVPTILRIADLFTMTVETQISEADIGNVKKGMRVYFTTLGGGNRRWYSTLRQILPTPVVESNVVLYTGLFDIDNKDAALLSEMTAQVYFITSAAENVLTVPVGALTYTDVPSSEDMTARFAAGKAMARGFPDAVIPPNMDAPFNEEMAKRRVAGGGFPNAGPPSRGNLPGSFGGPRRTGAAPSPGAHRSATVAIVKDDGSIEQRQVVIGVTSRITAEVISGLSVGDKVVAGIIQADSDEEPDNNSNRFRGPPGGFRRF